MEYSAISRSNTYLRVFLVVREKRVFLTAAKREKREFRGVGIFPISVSQSAAISEALTASKKGD